LVVKAAGGRFDQNSFTPKITFHIPVVSEQGKQVNKKEMDSFKSMAPLYDIDPAAFGQKLMLSGKPYTITGWNSKARTSPIMIESESGGRFKVKVDAVKRQFPLKGNEKVSAAKPKAKVVAPEEQPQQRCGYCGKMTDLSEIRMYVGGCKKPSCTLKSMREEDPKYENDVTRARAAGRPVKKQPKVAVVPKVGSKTATKGKAPLTDNQKLFVKDATRQGLEVSDYSGRGMYGAVCPSVVVEDKSHFKTKAKVKMDNMGMEYVIYAQY
jgi:hypothetical protein